MKIQKMPRLILALLLCFTLAESFRNGGNTNQQRNPKCRSPPKFKPIPAPSCPIRSRRTLELFRTKHAPPYVEHRTDQQIRDEHSQLIKQGYVFAGWHGTSFSVAEKLVDGDRFLVNPRQGDDRIWMGAYTADNVDICLGYSQKDKTFVLLRAYFKLPNGAESQTFVDDKDINHAVDPKHRLDICDRRNPTYEEMLKGTGKYLVCGPDGTGNGDELCISKDFLTGTNLKFLYSAHNKFITIPKGPYSCPELNNDPKDIEVTSVNWDLGSADRFINSMRSAKVFK